MCRKLVIKLSRGNRKKPGDIINHYKVPVLVKHVSRCSHYKRRWRRLHIFNTILAIDAGDRKLLTASPPPPVVVLQQPAPAGHVPFRNYRNGKRGLLFCCFPRQAYSVRTWYPSPCCGIKQILWWLKVDNKIPCVTQTKSLSSPQRGNTAGRNFTTLSLLIDLVQS